MAANDRPGTAQQARVHHILRAAEPADAPALAQLGCESFRAAFGHLYREGDLEEFLREAYGEAAVAREIADIAFAHCLAEGGGHLLGYCKMQHPSPYAHHSDARNPVALNQLYTRPELTGNGLGARLMDWALDEARRQGCDAIQLSVWSGNHAAQRFYARYGFAKIADIEFWVGSQCDEEFLFELRLGDGK